MLPQPAVARLALAGHEHDNVVDQFRREQPLLVFRLTAEIERRDQLQTLLTHGAPDSLLTTQLAGHAKTHILFHSTLRLAHQEVSKVRL